jgi:hypothetical protein
MLIDICAAFVLQRRAILAALLLYVWLAAAPAARAN